MKVKKKLKLHRETLLQLEASHLGQLRGAGEISYTYCNEVFCATGDTCPQSNNSWCDCTI